MPATEVFETTGTIWSPWPPSTKPVTSCTETCSSHAMNVRKRAVSSTPAMPKQRSRVSPVSFWATVHIASSGFVTVIMIVRGERSTRLRATSPTIFWFVCRRSSRDMPGLRAMPDVITQMSDSAVSS